MRLALVTDTHAGVRGDNQNFASFQRKFWKDVFYPRLKEEGITTIIHLGDIVDRRKYINFLTAKNLREDVIGPAMEAGYDFHVILGNHDVMFKNTNEVNVMDQVFHETKHNNLRWYTGPETVDFDGTKILMMPWINSSNHEESFKAMETTPASIMMGHLEIAGFEMHKGQASDHGFGMELFDRFDQVMSGHFHHRSRNRNIDYLGSPYEMTWSDYNDPKGFHIFDTATRELTFIENPHRMFHKIYYDDTGKDLESATVIPGGIDGAYVKVVVKSKSNPYWFDVFIDKLEKSGVLNVQIIDDGLAATLEDTEDLINEAEDTYTSLINYIGQLNINEAIAKDLEILVQALYTEALTLE